MRANSGRNTRGGAVLVFALLVLVVGATILGGIAQMAVTQSLAGQTEWDSAARRIQLENSRSLARQYILSQMWRGYGQIPIASLGSGSTGGLGGFSISAVEPGFGYWLSLRQDLTDRINPFNLFERGGFQSAWVSGSLTTSGGEVPWGFQVRTRSPVAAGFAFANHRPGVNNWAPLRRIDMQQADYAVGFPALPRMPVSSVTNASTGDSTGFLGFLLLPKAEAAFGDLLSTVSGVSADRTDPADPDRAAITIDLDSFGYYAGQSDSHFFELPNAVDLVSVDSGVTNTNYNVPVTDLLLTGTTATNNLPLQISIPASNLSLTNVRLSGNNSRIIYLYRQGAAPALSITTAGGNRTFRIGMTLYCPANLNISGALTIQGGIRTDKLITQSTGVFTLIPEENPTWKYDAIADRMMWLEDQRRR